MVVPARVVIGDRLGVRAEGRVVQRLLQRPLVRHEEPAAAQPEARPSAPPLDVRDEIVPINPSLGHPPTFPLARSGNELSDMAPGITPWPLSVEKFKSLPRAGSPSLLAQCPEERHAPVRELRRVLAVLRYLEGDSTSLEVDAMERLARDGELAAYRHDGFWQCMDTLRDLRTLSALWASGEAPWRVWSEATPAELEAKVCLLPLGRFPKLAPCRWVSQRLR